MMSSVSWVIENPEPLWPFWAPCFLSEDLRRLLGYGLLSPSLEGGLELFLLFLLSFSLSSAISISYFRIVSVSLLIVAACSEIIWACSEDKAVK